VGGQQYQIVSVQPGGVPGEPVEVQLQPVNPSGKLAIEAVTEQGLAVEFENTAEGGGGEGAPAPVDEVHEAVEDVLFGVSAEKRATYRAAEESEQWSCMIGGKLVVLPLAKLNDNYCDCDDFSDEPGTDACQGNGKFFCSEVLSKPQLDEDFPRHSTEKWLNNHPPTDAVNKDRRAKWVWLTAVNDGVCDCCDGSDESTSGAVCEHVC